MPTTMGMDRKIKKKVWTVKRISLILGGLAVVSLILYSFLFADNRSKLNVDSEKITISTVKNGTFQDRIPETGIVMPSVTYFMDAVEGGVINNIIRESGALVDKGDTILTLINSNLQLEVMNREAQLYEQINILRTTRLQLDQNDLQQRAQLAEIDYQLQLVKPQFERFKELVGKKLISEREFEEVAEQYEYNLRRKELTYESYRRDSVTRIRQLNHLAASEVRMMNSLEAVGHILDNLVIRAPRSGLLSTPYFEIGQSINQGERMGEVAILDSFKVRVAIDELYQPRVTTGQTGTFTYDGKEYTLRIYKVYPIVTEGNFEVDMEFVGASPAGIPRGQSVRLQLELGKSAEALLIPTGGFFRDTGGNWVYVVQEDGTRAERRNIRLGRKNTEYYEVLEGLEPGERVVTSSYENFGDNEVLVF